MERCVFLSLFHGTLFFCHHIEVHCKKRHTYLYWDYSGVEVGVATLFLSVHSIS